MKTSVKYEFLTTVTFRQTIIMIMTNYGFNKKNK